MQSDTTINKFLKRATGGKVPNPKTMLKPSLLFRLLKDPYGVYLDYHGPQEEALDETTRYDRIRMKGGESFENEWVRENYPGAVHIADYGLDGLRQTVEALCLGVPAIHHPQLWALSHDTYGQGDLLVRCDDAPSDLGPFHYRVKECKKSASLQEYMKLQGAMYDRMLARIQGYRPKSYEVVLPAGEETVLGADMEDDLRNIMELWKDIRDGTDRPELPGYDDVGSPWRIYANKQLAARKDVTIMAGFTARVRRKLQDELGVTDLDGLARLDQADFDRVFNGDSAVRHYWQVRSFLEKRPIVLPGAQVALPRRSRTIYLDFETSDGLCPLGEPPHAYMIGALEDSKYRPFVACGAEEEEQMFLKFLEYLGDPREAHLYHWTGYEVGVLTKAAERHPKLADRLRAVADACVDLYTITKESVVFPVSSYSLKDVAPALGFCWRQTDVAAMSSMVLYWEWLDGGADQKIKKVLTYNEDDVKALQVVDAALSQLAGN